MNGVPQAPQVNYSGGNWRTGLTRDQRQDLITKIYHELIRVTGEPPGTSVWMKASVYELRLFNESGDRTTYINKIARRLHLLKQRPAMASNMPMTMGLQQLVLMSPHAGSVATSLPTDAMAMQSQISQQQQHFMMQQRQQAGQHAQLSGTPTSQPATSTSATAAGTDVKDTTTTSNSAPTDNSVSAARAQQDAQRAQQRGQQDGIGELPRKMKCENVSPKGESNQSDTKNTAATGTNVSTDANAYWQRVGAMKAKYMESVMQVFKAFQKYISAVKEPNDSEQAKKLNYLITYVNFIAGVLKEEPGQNQARTMEDLDKVERYIHRIVLPYLLKIANDKGRSGTSPSVAAPGGTIPTVAASPSSYSGSMAFSPSFSQQMSSPMTPNMTPPESYGGVTYAQPSVQTSGMYMQTPMSTAGYGAMNLASSWGAVPSSRPGSSPTVSMSGGMDFNSMGMFPQTSVPMTSMLVTSMPTTNYNNMLGNMGVAQGSFGDFTVGPTNSASASTTSTSETVTSSSQQSDSGGQATTSTSNTPAQQLMTLVETL